MYTVDRPLTRSTHPTFTFLNAGQERKARDLSVCQQAGGGGGDDARRFRHDVGRRAGGRGVRRRRRRLLPLPVLRRLARGGVEAVGPEPGDEIGQPGSVSVGARRRVCVCDGEQGTGLLLQLARSLKVQALF